MHIRRWLLFFAVAVPIAAAPATSRGLGGNQEQEPLDTQTWRTLKQIIASIKSTSVGMTASELMSPANQLLIQQRSRAVLAFAADENNLPASRFAFAWQYYQLARRLEKMGQASLGQYKSGIPGTTDADQPDLRQAMKQTEDFVIGQQEDAERLADWITNICTNYPVIEGCKEAVATL